MPITVRVVGSLRGGLFALYVLGVPVVQKWRIPRAILALAVSVIPFGPLLFGKRLQRETDAVK